MRKLDRGMVGIAEGETVLFSDFVDDGAMWTGDGDRTVRHEVAFDEPFLDPPVVKVWVAMWDVSNESNVRLDLRAEDVGRHGFHAVASTWGDTRIARLRIAWLAIGPVADDDRWEID